VTPQATADASENLNIHTYRVWSAWAQEHALAELEREVANSGRSWLTPRRLPPALLVAWIAFAALLGLKAW